MSEYVRKYASEEALRQAENTAVSSSSESSMSDFSEDEAQVNIVQSLFQRGNKPEKQFWGGNDSFEVFLIIFYFSGYGVVTVGLSRPLYF